MCSRSTLAAAIHSRQAIDGGRGGYAAEPEFPPVDDEPVDAGVAAGAGDELLDEESPDDELLDDELSLEDDELLDDAGAELDEVPRLSLR